MNVLLECRHAGHHVDVLEDGVVQPRLPGPAGASLLLQHGKGEDSVLAASGSNKERNV